MRVDLEKLLRAKKPPERDRRGNPLCRECSRAVSPPRRSFCSNACVHAWKMATNPTYVRQRVRKRDKGKCAECGLDTERLRRSWMSVARQLPKHRWPTLIMRAQLEGYSGRVYVRYGRLRVKKLWDADHETPVHLGGGLCGLEGYVTLCVPCHKKKTQMEAQCRTMAKKSTTKKVDDLTNLINSVRM